jgi:hypothetical protein
MVHVGQQSPTCTYRCDTQQTLRGRLIQPQGSQDVIPVIIKVVGNSGAAAAYQQQDCHDYSDCSTRLAFLGVILRCLKI